MIRLDSCLIANFTLYYFEALKSFWRIWIHFASPISTGTVCIHFSSIDPVGKLLQRVDKCLITCNEELTLLTQTREWTECWALQGRDFCEKSSKSICSTPFIRQKTTQTSGSVFAERIEKIKETKFELYVFKSVDCSLDGHGNYDSNLLVFKTKSFNKQFVLLQLARVSSVPKNTKC